MNSKNIVIAVLALVLIGAVGYLFLSSSNSTEVMVDETSVPTDTTTTPVETNIETEEGTESTVNEVTLQERGDESIIGSSNNGNDLTAYHFGDGDTEILFVGGVHGGYSPNTSALAEEMISSLENDELTVPENVMVTVIPTLNPDGLEKSGADGRFNANNVDLNRNFDCEWSADAVWRNQEVSGGDAPFSEPEAAALRDYVERYEPEAAVVWFSAEGKVYPSACNETPSKQSVELAATFATAAGYGAAAEFDAYTITGDMVNWMADQNIPAISVLLTDHSNTEWSKNKAGIEAVINSYAE